MRVQRYIKHQLTPLLAPINRQIHLNIAPLRVAAPSPSLPPLRTPPTRKLPSQLKREAAELAKAGFTDIFDFLAHNTTEELNVKEPVDFELLFKNPARFKDLSFNQKNTVIEELENYKLSNWGEIPIEMKRLMYYVSYGNWGPRSSFQDPLTPDYSPEDAPFTHRSDANARKVVKLPPVDLHSVSEERKREFEKNVRKLDPFSQFVVIFGFLISGLALLSDKWADFAQPDLEDTRPGIEHIADDVSEECESVEMINDFERSGLRLGNGEHKRKWYFLWLF